MLQFLTANATRQALEIETSLQVKLKWPNDLVLGSEKLGGILVESKTMGDTVSFAILGIGLNVNQDKDRLPPGAISLRLASGIQHDLRGLLRAVIDQMSSRYEDLDKPSRIIEEWWRNCVHRESRVEAKLLGTTVTGITRGIDQDGGLVIETEGKRIQKVGEGSISLLDD